jgi:hypothetical protein
MSEVISMKKERDKNHRFYRNISIASALYSVLSVYLLFASVKAIFQNDTQYFDFNVVAWVLLGTVVYGLYCYRKIKQLDGVNSKGLGWKLMATQVKLPERKVHRRFG